MIAIRALVKQFGPLRVLNGLDLEIQAGRVTAVIGPNGSGKTTLIKSILGLTRPDGGEIHVGGTRVNGDCAYRSRIGYMPQLAHFPENLTGAEVLNMLADLRGATLAECDMELAELFAIASQLGKPVRTLSGGTRQKLNAVCAFMFRPDVLILDEPTAGLDPVASGILKDKIAREREAGRTFVLTSHIVSELEELSDNVAFLIDGSVRFSGTMADLKHRTGEARLERAVARLMTRAATLEIVA